MSDTQIRATITARDDASGVVAGFSNSLEGAGLSFGKLTGAFVAGQAIFYAVEGALKGIGDIIGDTISKAEKFQDAEVGLQYALNNNVDITDKSTASLLKQADALSNVTGFSEQAYVAADDLLAIHKLSQSQITSLVPHIADLAQGLANVTGEAPDLVANTKLITKAIGEGDIAGFTGALRRANIFLSDHQMEVLKTGNMQQKLGAITELLSQHFAGLSTADQASIKMAILNNQFEKAQEKIGLALLPSISRLAEKLATFVESDQFQAWIQKAADWIGNKLPPIMDKLINVWIPQAKKSFDEWWPKIKFTADVIGALAGVVITAWVIIITWNEILINSWNKLGRQIGDVVNWFIRLPGLILNAVGGFGNLLYNAGQSLINGMVRGINDAAGAVGRAVTGIATGALHNAHIPGFASGVQNFSGGLAIVGERGPELVQLPSGSNVIPNNQLSGATGTNINLSVNVGVYAGTEIEKRKLAQSLFMALSDVAKSQNTTVANMMGSV